MSLLPEVPASALDGLFSRHEIEVKRSSRGVRFHRARDGATYRAKVSHDGYVSGTALLAACRVFGIDPFDLL